MSAQAFSVDERTEIITKLAALENGLEAVQRDVQTMVDLMHATPTDDEGNAQGVPVNMLAQVHAFCMQLASTLDALGGNPMVAAMLPADSLPSSFGQEG